MASAVRASKVFRKGKFHFFDDPDDQIKSGDKVASVDGEKAYLGDVIRYGGYRAKNTLIATVTGWVEPDTVDHGNYLVVPASLNTAPWGYWSVDEEHDGWLVVGVEPNNYAINELLTIEEDLVGELDMEPDTNYTVDELHMAVRVIAYYSKEYYQKPAQYVSANLNKLVRFGVDRKRLDQLVVELSGEKDMMVGLFHVAKSIGLQALLIAGY